MKYQKGDLVMWIDDSVIIRDNYKERYMIIIQHDIIKSGGGYYTYRYIDTGRKDEYIDQLLEQATQKVGWTMKYQKGDLVIWKHEVLKPAKDNEKIMIVTNTKSSTTKWGFGIYEYMYLETGRTDHYVDYSYESDTKLLEEQWNTRKAIWS